MPQVKRLLRERGVEFKGAFASTPICCPSRSTILTGMHTHNHHVHTNNQNCSGKSWREKFEPRSVAVYLKEAGYATAYFGKYLNEYDGSYIPPGWDTWVGLIKNSRFYNYSLNVNGERRRHGFEYDQDYLTDVLTNQTLKYMSNHLMSHPWQPLFIVVSYPAPHGPEDPAPQHSHLFEGVDTHIKMLRTESWNYAPNPDKQWLLRRTGKMEPVHVVFTGLLHQRRLQTLQSVDESVRKILSELRSFNQLSSTYVLYTSDHGYHLGQFGLVKGKNMPYEFDIRIPFLLRGPGVPRNITIRNPVMNVDIAPTLLDMAGLAPPSHMDGRSVLDLTYLTQGRRRSNRQLQSWRHTVLIERGKMPKLKKIRERFQKQKDLFSKEIRLKMECAKNEYHAECEPGQQWKCYRADDGRWRIYKCREKCPCYPRKSRGRRDRGFRNQRRQLKHEMREWEKSGDEKKASDWTRDFLAEAHEKELIKRGEWFQGAFALPESFNRTKRSLSEEIGEPICYCSPSKNHPLRENWSTASLRVLKRRKNADGQPSRQPKECSQAQMNCFTHGAEHWRTPPLWPHEFGPFCFCQNANNNTYWCLRTINATHNFLYCEFITEFVSFYDLNADPFQLTNIVFNLPVETLEELSEQLKRLRHCVGHWKCEHFSSSRWRDPVPPVSEIQ